jgi:hypothetical protein
MEITNCSEISYDVQDVLTISFFRKYGAKINPALKEISANCLTTNGTVRIDNETINVFCKLVKYPADSKKDHIMVDNFNAIVFSANPHYSKHFLKYIDSFTSKYDETSHESNVPQAQAQSILNMLLTQSLSPEQKRQKLVSLSWTIGDIDTLYCPGKKITPQHKCNVSICEEISGLSLSKLLEELLMKSPEEVFGKCHEFLLALIELGCNFGFIHNDLHFDNVFFNSNTKTLMFIDYGRAYIAEHRLFMGDRKINWEKIYKENGFSLKSTSDGYNSIKPLIHWAIPFSDARPKCKYPSGLMDFMTFTGNLYLYFRKYIKQEWPKEFDELISFTCHRINTTCSFISVPHLKVAEDGEKDGKGMLGEIIKTSKKVCDAVKLKFKESTTCKLFLLINEGLTYIALILWYFQTHEKTNLRGVPLYDTKHIFWICFQLQIDIDQFKRFYLCLQTELDENTHDIAHLSVYENLKKEGHVTGSCAGGRKEGVVMSKAFAKCVSQHEYNNPMQYRDENKQRPYKS